MSESMIEIVDAESANVMIGALGHHVWVCTETGTVLRIKAGTVTLDDRRIARLRGAGSLRRGDVAILEIDRPVDPAEMRSYSDHLHDFTDEYGIQFILLDKSIRTVAVRRRLRGQRGYTPRWLR